MKIDTMIKMYGSRRLATICGVTHPTVLRWVKTGLPYSEYTGTTDYAGALAKFLNRPEVTRNIILEANKNENRARPGRKKVPLSPQEAMEHGGQ